MKLFVGHDAGSLQGRRFNLTGPRMFNGQYGPDSKFDPNEVSAIEGWCDSGAFNDAPEDRLLPEAALDRQLVWEEKASRKWGTEYHHNALVSYDLLIDEKWVGGKKTKERWTVAEAVRAVDVTVSAAEFLSANRNTLRPRRLVLACQGVDEVQYAECAAGVLAHCRPGDVFGLGGWCILGMRREWLPTFWESMRRTLPMVAAAGLKDVHIFGVMWRKALGGLVWLADRYGLTVSTDSKKAASDCTWKSATNARKAGRKKPTWEENVAWWVTALANLRDDPLYYREPPPKDHDFLW